MVLDSALADAEIRGDVLAGVTARTISMISRCLGVRSATWLAASSCQASSLLESRDCSRARSTQTSNSPRLIGFSIKSEAPAFIASTAIATSLLPVIMMAGR